MSPDGAALRLAVLTDLHAYDTVDGTPPSHLCISKPEGQATQHPIGGLMRLIEAENLRADVLICCGDMADKARPIAVRYVWSKLQDLRDALAAPFMAVAPGNHDVDSRYKYNDFDAKGVLQSLTPPFPFPDIVLNDKFWSRNYIVHTAVEFNLVLLNTSAYHGNHAPDRKPVEYEHGRISRSTLDWLQKDLDVVATTNPRTVNILACHHHPHKYSDIDSADYSDMEGGSDLLSLLGSGRYGHWLIIHGHKHHPKVWHAAGGAYAPIIFAAGSFSANLYPALQTRVRNQFYVIELPWPQFEALQLTLAGTFRSWEWLTGSGWQPASPGAGLPAFGGFGFRGSLPALAATVEHEFVRLNAPVADWSQLTASVPQLNFVLPDDVARLFELLRTQYGLRMLDDHGRPAQLGRA